VCPECGAEQPRAPREIEEERGHLERIRVAAEQRAELRVRVAALAQRRGLSDYWVQQTMQRLTE